MIFIFLLFQKDDLQYPRKGSKNKCHWRKFWIKRTIPQQRLTPKGLWKNSLPFLIKRNPANTLRMQQSTYHNTHKWPWTSNLVTHTCTRCFWVLSVTGSIWECDWLKTVLPKRRITSTFWNTAYWLWLCKFPPAVLPLQIKIYIHSHISVVDRIQGRAEPNTNAWLSFLNCSPIIVVKEFKDLQLSNFRLHMNVLLRKQQTALGADTSCWSCLVASGSSSTSYRVRFLLSSTSFAIYDATGI